MRIGGAGPRSRPAVRVRVKVRVRVRVRVSNPNPITNPNPNPNPSLLHGQLARRAGGALEALLQPRAQAAEVAGCRVAGCRLLLQPRAEAAERSAGRTPPDIALGRGAELGLRLLAELGAL